MEVTSMIRKIRSLFILCLIAALPAAAKEMKLIKFTEESQKGSYVSCGDYFLQMGPPGIGLLECSALTDERTITMMFLISKSLIVVLDDSKDAPVLEFVGESSEPTEQKATLRISSSMYKAAAQCIPKPAMAPNVKPKNKPAPTPDKSATKT